MIHRREQTAPALQHLGRHGGGLGKVAHLVIGIVRIPGLERFASAPQPNTAAQFPGEGGVFRNGNIRRHQSGEARFVRDDRTHRGMVSKG